MSSEIRYALIGFAILVVALALVHKPLGGYLARTYTDKRHLKAERVIYRAVGVDPDADQPWGQYVRSVLYFSAAGAIVLYGIIRLQRLWPMTYGRTSLSPAQAFNTAVSFVTNTNWQSYSGETLSHTVQMLGLTVQNFVSAATGMAVVIALVRGLIRVNTDRLGNFWVDLVRTVVRVLLPMALIAAVVLIAGGVIQNFSGSVHSVGIAGMGQQIPGGPVASQEAIKELGTNGGGFFNANSAHPFENPTWWTNLFEIFLLLAIPFSLPYTFGRMINSVKQGIVITASMAVMAIGSWVANLVSELHTTGAMTLAGAAMEGKELRFGVGQSTLFSTATTLTSTGAVDSWHSSYSPISGGTLILNMALGEVAPGGTGSGLYGILILAMVAVFIAGLMVGRTPEFLGKHIGTREMKLVSLYILITPILVLVGTATALAIPSARASILNAGPHGLSEVLYAFTSGANNNGSAFAGLNANTGFYNVAIGVAMLFGRFVPIVLVLALAGALAKQKSRPVTAGTLSTHGPMFVVLLVGVSLIVVALTYFPALALGPLAEGL